MPTPMQDDTLEALTAQHQKLVQLAHKTVNTSNAAEKSIQTLCRHLTEDDNPVYAAITYIRAATAAASNELPPLPLEALTALHDRFNDEQLPSQPAFWFNAEDFDAEHWLRGSRWNKRTHQNPRDYANATLTTVGYGLLFKAISLTSGETIGFRHAVNPNLTQDVKKLIHTTLSDVLQDQEIRTEAQNVIEEAEELINEWVRTGKWVSHYGEEYDLTIPSPRPTPQPVDEDALLQGIAEVAPLFTLVRNSNEQHVAACNEYRDALREFKALLNSAERTPTPPFREVSIPWLKDNLVHTFEYLGVAEAMLNDRRTTQELLSDYIKNTAYPRTEEQERQRMEQGKGKREQEAQPLLNYLNQWGI